MTGLTERLRHDEHLRHEVVTMALYTSIVLLAALLALPDDYALASHDPSGHQESSLAVVIWGSTLGLVAAHWFAFGLASTGFRQGLPARHDLHALVGQALGAGVPAGVATLVILVNGDGNDVNAAGFGPAAIVGFAGYFAARAAGRTRVMASTAGIVCLLVAVGVALLKVLLGGH